MPIFHFSAQYSRRIFAPVSLSTAVSFVAGTESCPTTNFYPIPTACATLATTSVADLHRRRHRTRLPRKDAPVATARELACLIYTMVTRGEAYVEKGMEACGKRRIGPTLANLRRKARTAATNWSSPPLTRREQW